MRDQWFKCCPRNWNLFLARECLESLTNPILFTSFGATQLIVSTLALAKILKADWGSTTREPSIAGLLGIGRGASSGRKNILTTLQPRSERTGGRHRRAAKNFLRRPELIRLSKSSLRPFCAFSSFSRFLAEG